MPKSGGQPPLYGKASQSNRFYQHNSSKAVHNMKLSKANMTTRVSAASKDSLVQSAAS